MVSINLNQLHNKDCVVYMQTLPDESVDLIIADPPYFKVVNEQWDYIWKNESDYLEWCSHWFKECYRILRLGGTIYIYGYFRMIAHYLPLLEGLGFELRQQIVLNKGLRAISGRATKNYKLFPNVTESILFLYKDPKPYVKNTLKQRQEDLGLSSKEINEALGVKSNGGGMWSIYTGKNVCKQLPTEELWNKLQQILQFDLPYKKICQTYNPQMGLTDVWDDIDFYKEQRIHPTQKPLNLSERLIKASSNENDIVYIPFAGSGSEILACINNDRKWIATELDENYVNLINERIKESEMNKPLW